ncbi:S8 family peptidase, partial [Candidatus Sumerlaeota bacterium]|nr:S8 family peptidase [Candidatus Sumerlaeota bacterium]
VLRQIGSAGASPSHFDTFIVLRCTKSANDDNGHGTHVAGTVAAVNNTIGVVGVAPAANLYAVKVLSRTGTGYLSDLIEGLDWCISNKMQVVNMSLGSSSDNQSFHDAVIRVYQAGITQVAAAGNANGGAVTYPAKYGEVIAVTASDINDQFASFSSQGPEVDLIAPGVSINSTYTGSSYKVLNGTSMASPHVTGIVALRLQVKPGENPDAVKAVLQSTALPLPGLTLEQQGAGLPQALSVVKAP